MLLRHFILCIGCTLASAAWVIAADNESAQTDPEIWLTAEELIAEYNDDGIPAQYFMNETINISLERSVEAVYEQEKTQLVIMSPESETRIRCLISVQHQVPDNTIPEEGWSVRGTCRGLVKDANEILVAECKIFPPGTRYPDVDKGVVY